MMSNVGAEILAKQVRAMDKDIRAEGSLEGKDPLIPEIEFYPGYHINFLGQVTNAEKEPMTPIVNRKSSFPSVRITRKTEQGPQKQKKYKIEELMDKFFGPYIEGYSDTYAVKKEKRLERYKLIPIDGDRSNTCIDNLKYVKKERACDSEVTSTLITAVLKYSTANLSDKEIAKIFGVQSKCVAQLRALVSGEREDDAKDAGSSSGNKKIA